jgi:hypothetical protein
VMDAVSLDEGLASLGLPESDRPESLDSQLDDDRLAEEGGGSVPDGWLGLRFMISRSTP